MATEDTKKIDNKDLRHNIAEDIKAIRNLKTASAITKKDLIGHLGLLEKKQATQTYDIREKQAESIKLEDKPFTVNSDSWTKEGEKKAGEGKIKIKMNDEEDIIEITDGPYIGQQFFVTYEALIREVSKAKGGISQEEIEKKYLLSYEDLSSISKERNKNESYTKFYTTYIKDNFLCGFFRPEADLSYFVDMGKRMHIRAVGGNRDIVITKNGWSEAPFDIKRSGMCYLKKQVS